MVKKKDLRDQLKQHSENKLAKIVFDSFTRHASEYEKETFREKMFMALALEVERSNKKEQEFFHSCCELEGENMELKKKLKIRNPKSKIRNKP